MGNDVAVIATPPITPMDLIARGQQSGASIEQMQQLFDLQLRYEANEARKAYNDAMSNFREECPTINRGRTVSHNNTRFAGLAESIEAIRSILAKHGLSHQWKTRQDSALITVECIVTHRLGHSESTSLSASPDKSGGKNDIQAVGSTVSYLERYTLYAILGLSSKDMDDDGNGAGKGSAEVPTITEAQSSDLLALIENVGADVAKFCTYWKIDMVKCLPASKFESAVKMLEKKRGA
jgi:ERF superfamily